jgi:hypothetical protein
MNCIVLFYAIMYRHYENGFGTFSLLYALGRQIFLMQKSSLVTRLDFKMTIFRFQIWKVFHAETIRAIWNARCAKVFDGETHHLEALKGKIRSRVQGTFSIYASSPKAAQAQIAVWRSAFPIAQPRQSGRFKLHIPL